VAVGDDVTLHVHRWRGVGTPFLLVHGLASNLQLWEAVAARLAGWGHAVIAVDLRGHGRSDKPDAGYDFATIIDDLAALVEALGVDRPVVAGQSWGANVALELAWRRPEQVRGVACVDGGWIELRRRFPDWDECARVLAPPDTTGRTSAEIEAGVRARHPDWPESGIRATLACFEHLGDGTVRPWLARARHLAILRALWEHEPSTRYAGVKVPVLLVPADPGPGSDAEWDHGRKRHVEEAAAALTSSRLHWMAGDHDLHAQHPDEVAEVLHRATADGFFP
jgi:pimeloyl-ACP methyl ester carboxylesterase